MASSGQRCRTSVGDRVVGVSVGDVSDGYIRDGVGMWATVSRRCRDRIGVGDVGDGVVGDSVEWATVASVGNRKVGDSVGDVSIGSGCSPDW